MNIANNSCSYGWTMCFMCVEQPIPYVWNNQFQALGTGHTPALYCESM